MKNTPTNRFNAKLIELCTEDPAGITDLEIGQLHRDQPGVCLQYLVERLTPDQFKKCVKHFCSALRYVPHLLNPEQKKAAMEGAPAVALREMPWEISLSRTKITLAEKHNHKLVFQTPIPASLIERLEYLRPRLSTRMKDDIDRHIAAMI